MEEIYFSYRNSKKIYIAPLTVETTQ